MSGRSTVAIAAGIYFIATGALLLLAQTGAIDLSGRVLLALGLVALGLGVIAGAPRRPSSEAHEEPTSHPTPTPQSQTPEDLADGAGVDSPDAQDDHDGSDGPSTTEDESG